MKETERVMFEVNWHFSGNDIFSHITVSPIKIVGEDVLPGCSSVTISAVDSDGNSFRGVPEDYYLTEEAAWAAVREEILESLSADEAMLAILQQSITNQREWLKMHS